LVEDLNLIVASEVKIRELIREELITFRQELLAEIVKQKNDQDSDELMNRNELLKMLRISSTTLYFRMQEGTIPYLKFGRRVYFKKNEVMKSLETHNLQFNKKYPYSK
jgi:excisionase family DNA binding protein